MDAIHTLKLGLTFSHTRTRGAIESLRDHPVAQPTEAGGNHATWIAGHLAYREFQVINWVMLGKTNPLAHWKDMFDMGSTPKPDGALYPALDELVGAFDDAHANTLAVLESMSDADLDTPSVNPPERAIETFRTRAHCLSLMVVHPAIHLGQLTDVRRVVGIARVM